jgi:hypothetical protein
MVWRQDWVVHSQAVADSRIPVSAGRDLRHELAMVESLHTIDHVPKPSRCRRRLMVHAVLTVRASQSMTGRIPTLVIPAKTGFILLVRRATPATDTLRGSS